MAIVGREGELLLGHAHQSGLGVHCTLDSWVRSATHRPEQLGSHHQSPKIDEHARGFAPTALTAHTNSRMIFTSRVPDPIGFEGGYVTIGVTASGSKKTDDCNLLKRWMMWLLRLDSNPQPSG